ncbi:hypothetical protein HOY82DRAFT_273382 [Tuber indicum]|nr:hypothetical protein HOY82DRAFT_273382 [Tuber indicum]
MHGKPRLPQCAGLLASIHPYHTQGNHSPPPPPPLPLLTPTITDHLTIHTPSPSPMSLNLHSANDYDTIPVLVLAQRSYSTVRYDTDPKSRLRTRPSYASFFFPLSPLFWKACPFLYLLAGGLITVNDNDGDNTSTRMVMVVLRTDIPVL